MTFMSFAHSQTMTDLEKIKSTKELRVGAASAYPFYDRAIDGSWAGLIPDVMQSVSAKLGVKIIYVEAEWGTAAAGLQSNRFDIMGAFNRTPERALAVDFTIPIGTTAFGLLSLSDTSTKYPTWASLDKQEVKLTTVDGTGTHRTTAKIIPNVTWVLMKNFETLLLEIDSQRSEITLMDAVQAKRYIDTRKRGFFHAPSPRQSSFTNLAVRKSSDGQLRDALDKIIVDMEKSGELAKIWAKYVPPSK